MKRQIARRLDALRQDFAQIAGRPFNHFFCPFLFVDEETELCKAHVVNAAFAASSRRWTLQRKDVDNFFGSMIESAFVDLRFDEAGIAVRSLVEPLRLPSLAALMTDGFTFAGATTRQIAHRGES
jgi:hypothetical protein